jgi:hypothetical protein
MLRLSCRGLIMLKTLAIAVALLGAPTAFAQTAASCPTAKPGGVWAKGAWLPCSTTPVFVAQPVAARTLVSDMRCPASGCVFSWQLGPDVLPTDQVWVKTAAKPAGTWVKASTLQFATGPNAQCTKFLYTGAPFTLVTTVTGPNSPSVTSPVTGSVTLVNPLPANGTTTFAPTLAIPSVLAGVASWDFSSQYAPINSTDAGGAPWDLPTFTFTTSNGVIVSWMFTVPYFVEPDAGDSFRLSITGTVNGDTVTADRREEIFPPLGESSITGSSSSPGTWTCQVTFTSNYP